MDNFISAILIAIVQGLTEWLPVSSSGHLVVFQRILDYNGGLIFDVALHFGTLMAVFVYFGKDIVEIIEDVLKWRKESENFKLAILLLIGTIPAAFFGIVFKRYFEMAFESLGLVAVGFAITGLILFISSLSGRGKKMKKEFFGYGKALFVGLAQALAIFPGISRSGATISAGLISGLNEKNAVKFSFLLAIPAIFGAAIIEIGNNTLPRELIWATLASFFVGLAGIHFMLKILTNSRKNLAWFGVYCIILAVGIGVYIVFF